MARASDRLSILCAGANIRTAETRFMYGTNQRRVVEALRADRIAKSLILDAVQATLALA